MKFKRFDMFRKEKRGKKRRREDKRRTSVYIDFLVLTNVSLLDSALKNTPGEFLCHYRSEISNKFAKALPSSFYCSGACDARAIHELLMRLHIDVRAKRPSDVFLELSATPGVGRYMGARSSTTEHLSVKSLHARALSITRQNVIAIQISTLASSFRVGVSQITPDARFPFRQVHLPFIPVCLARRMNLCFSRE